VAGLPPPGLENFPPNPKFFNFFTVWSTKISAGRVKKYPGQSWAGLCLDQARVEMGPGLTRPEPTFYPE